MKRVPIVATLMVAIAVAAMIGLGLWQLLDRLPKKEAFLAQLAANPAKPPIAFPRTADDRLLFRPSFATCVPPIAIRRAGAGAAGYRLIAKCRDAMQVQIGTTRAPMGDVAWAGGAVSGYVSHAPDSRPLIAGLFDSTPTPLLLVLDQPAAGLRPNPRPSIESVPNNHLAYAGQWFFFAVIAAIIYVLALRRRQG